MSNFFFFFVQNFDKSLNNFDAEGLLEALNSIQS